MKELNLNIVLPSSYDGSSKLKRLSGSVTLFLVNAPICGTRVNGLCANTTPKTTNSKAETLLRKDL